MDRTERDALERYDDQHTGFVPSFMSRFRVTEGTCTACGCPCAEHWESLANGAHGWVGCTYALKQEVTRLRAELAQRKAS